jgi:hypothetical protein
MCLQGWVFAHFKTLVPRKREEDYLHVDPLGGKWKPPREFSDPEHFITAIDSMEHAHVIWRPYETRRDMTPF